MMTSLAIAQMPREWVAGCYLVALVLAIIAAFWPALRPSSNILAMAFAVSLLPPLWNSAA